MTIKMTPVRWLLAVAIAAAMYVAVVVTALLFGSPIPQQIHSVVLTAMTAGVLVAAVAQILKRHDTGVHEALDRRDGVLYAQIATMSRRLAVLCPPAVDESRPQPEVTGEIQLRPSVVGVASVGRPDNVVAFELGRAAERSAEKSRR